MKVFILGAADPEMEEIERVVKAEGHEVRYALNRGYRVRAESAYEADNVNAVFPLQQELVFVECSVMGLTPTDIVDHHQPGDPGYGKSPADYLEGSSLGQVLQLLKLEPTAQQRVIAAADHCPTQAYRGECPGVSPQALAAWRTQSRAARRGLSFEEMEAAIVRDHQKLLEADRIDFCGQSIPWIATRDGEFSEASARFGIPFMYAQPSLDGGTKLGIMGATPEVIERWMQDCGLARVYGDPMRGYAGGYC